MGRALPSVYGAALLCNFDISVNYFNETLDETTVETLELQLPLSIFLSNIQLNAA